MLKSTFEILDFAIDLRPESETYLNSVSVVLSEANKKQLFVPKGFGHTFITLKEDSMVSYKVDNHYNYESEMSINYKEFDLGINAEEKYILSEKDINAKGLKNFEEVINGYSNNWWE